MRVIAGAHWVHLGARRGYVPVSLQKLPCRCPFSTSTNPNSSTGKCLLPAFMLVLHSTCKSLGVGFRSSWRCAIKVLRDITASESKEDENLDAAKAGKRGTKQHQALAGDLADPLLVVGIALSLHRILPPTAHASTQYGVNTCLHMQTCSRPYERPAGMHCKCRWRLNGPLQCPSRPHRNRQHDRGDLSSPSVHVARDSLLAQLAGTVLPFGNAFWR